MTNGALHFKRGPERWQNNEPTYDEVAAVFNGEDGAPPVRETLLHIYISTDRPP